MKSEDFKMKMGDSAPNFNLPGVDGEYYSLDSFYKNFLVIIWTCNHCPFAKAYEDKFVSLCKDFGHEIDFVAINSNDAVNYPEDSFEKMRERAEGKGFSFPYLFDETQQAARDYGALVTPHVYIFDKDKKLIYQGGVDDAFRNGDYNNQAAIESEYLKDALSCLVSGRDVERRKSPVVGCSVKWKG